MEIENVLKSIYYDTVNPNSYSTAEKLYKAAKEILPNLTIKEVNDWLSGQFTYTLHKAPRRTFKRNPIVVEVKDQQWEADLVDMQEFKKSNKGNNYILTVIDVLSKYAWGIPLKNKRGTSIVKAFEKIIDQSNRYPIYIRTDQGKEFLNKDFKEFLKNKGIRHFTSKNFDIKCAVVERFNRTLKGRMFKYFTSKGNRVWYNIIDDLLVAYNNSKHRSIKMTPVEATDTESEVLFKNIYGFDSWGDLYRDLKNDKNKELEENDKVRQVYKKGPFDKSYYPNWSDQLFEIDKKISEPNKPLYKLIDEKNEPVDGRKYDEQLQKVKENVYRIEKVIKTRKVDGIEQSFIKWLNYPDSFNSWVNNSDIEKL